MMYLEGSCMMILNKSTYDAATTNLRKKFLDVNRLEFAARKMLCEPLQLRNYIELDRNKNLMFNAG